MGSGLDLGVGGGNGKNEERGEGVNWGRVRFKKKRNEI